MTIVQQGQVNTTALIVPDLLVQIVPPQVSLLNGVPTNVLGVVGTATWGPVNAPTILGSMADYSLQFGPIQTAKYDGGTIIATAVQQGASNFRFVRVTDGTDAAASVVVQTNGVTLTSKYTGSLGNSIQYSISNGSQANTFRVTITLPGLAPEVFDNLAGTGNAFWVNLAAAINQGQYGLRAPSAIVVASAGASTSAPTLVAGASLAGGTDGNTTITAATLIGADTTTRTGMYALRRTGTSVAVLADCDTSTTWATQLAFGLSEGIYMILVGPQGDTVANAASVKSTAGIDSYAFKLLHGDWVYWLDTVNGKTRLVSPQGFIAGLLSNLSPEQSSLNKPLFGVVSTQRSSQNRVYSNAELQVFGQAGIDVITNPSPGGNYFSARFGHNGSSNPVINGDNYTRLTNYVAATIDAGMGKFIGKLQSPTVRRQAKATLDNFFFGMEQQGMIGDVSGGPAFKVTLDNSNNPIQRVALGYMQADCQVVYLSVIEKFLINVEGGQSVQILRQGTTQV